MEGVWHLRTLCAPVHSSWGLPGVCHPWRPAPRGPGDSTPRTLFDTALVSGKWRHGDFPMVSCGARLRPLIRWRAETGTTTGGLGSTIRLHHAWNRAVTPVTTTTAIGRTSRGWRSLASTHTPTGVLSTTLN